MRHKPLTCTQVKMILKRLGFVFESQKSSSHEHWGKVTPDGRRFKVTVDCPKAPFGQDLITYMARQAGVSKAEFYQALEENNFNKER